MNKGLNVLFLFALIAVLFSACYHNKKLIYFEGREFSEGKGTLVESKRQAYRLQTYDVISVQIKGSGETVSSIFNIAPAQSMFVNPGNLYLEGYTVDENGKITLPVIGDLVVKDLTVEEAQKVVQQHADKYLTKAIVIVKLTSFKITVLGEVKNPGYYYVYNSQATILEGLGMAGDLTNFGNRENVKLIRPAPGGSEVVLLNLTDTNLLKSPYFFLMPGDVVYVEPLRARSSRSNLDLLTVLFSALTTAVLVLSYVNSNN